MDSTRTREDLLVEDLPEDPTADLAEELVALRRRVAELEAAEAARKRRASAAHTHVKSTQQQNESNYRALIDMLPISVYRTTPGLNGKFLMANPAFLAMFGFETEEEIRQIPVVDLYVDPQDRLRFSEAVLSDGHVNGMELQLKRKDGTPVWLLATARAVYAEDGPEPVYFDGTVEDITGLKQAQEALQASETRYRTTIDSMHDVIHVVDANLQFILANEAFRKWNQELGLMTDVVGRDLFEVYPFLTEGVRGEYRQVFESGCMLVTEGTTQLGAQQIATETRKIPIVERGRVTRVITVIRNVSERRQAAQALWESEARYRSLFEDSPISLWEEDFSALKQRLEQLRQQGVTDFGSYLETHPDIVGECLALARVTDVNNATLELYEAHSKEEILIGLDRLVPPEVYHCFREELVSIAAGQTRFEWQGVNCTLSGKYIDVNVKWSAAPGYEDSLSKVMVSIEDITERKRTEAENARLYHELERRLAQTQVLREMMLAASSTLNFDLVLQRTCETLQTTMQVEFLGVVFPGEQPGVLVAHPSIIGYASHSPVPLEGSMCGRAFQTGELLLVPDVRQISYYFKDEEDVRSAIAVPVRAAGRIIGVLNVESRQINGFSQDDLSFYAAIASQLGVALENARLYEQVRHHAEELSSLVDRLRELDHLKSEFIQNVSHELRSPLALIRGYAELLANGTLGALNPEQQEPVAIIARRAQMLGNLVEDITLILLAEARPTVRESIALDALAQAAVEDFRVAADQAGLVLQTELGPGLPPVSGVPLYLRRVLDNLIGNAVKFTPAGGTVTVRMQQQGDQVVLQVTDTGIGIPPDKLDHIFERFYQVDGSSRRRYGGVGLGLALVKELVETCGGQVAVESQAGRGSTFTITLPVDAERRGGA